MKTVTLPGGSGGGSKKLAVHDSVYIQIYDQELEDGIDGVVAVDPGYIADKCNTSWDDGYMTGKLNANKTVCFWQIVSVVWIFATLFTLAYFLVNQ